MVAEGEQVERTAMRGCPGTEEKGQAREGAPFQGRSLVTRPSSHPLPQCQSVHTQEGPVPCSSGNQVSSPLNTPA